VTHFVIPLLIEKECYWEARFYRVLKVRTLLNIKGQDSACMILRRVLVPVFILLIFHG